MEKQDFKLVLIEWRDSKVTTSGWEFLSDMRRREPDPVMIRSVGYLTRETDDAMEIAPHLSDPDEDGDRQACGVMVIPKVCIDHCRALVGGSPMHVQTDNANGGVIHNYSDHERLVPRDRVFEETGRDRDRSLGSAIQLS